MAWTQADVDAVKAAILKLATGERVVSVTFSPSGGVSRTTSYEGSGGLDKLRALLAEMERSVTAAPQFRRAAFSKGFYPPRGSDG